MELIYHTDENVSGGISPFDETILEMCKNQKLLLTCPYITISYVQDILETCQEWKIISDVVEWLGSNADDSRRRIVDFIINNIDRIHHYPNLHAKVIIAGDKALVGSANFTKKGITKNIEMSVLISENTYIQELNKWFGKLWAKSDNIDVEKLEKISEYLSKISHNDVKSEYLFPSNVPQVNARLAPRAAKPKEEYSNDLTTDLKVEQLKSSVLYKKIKVVFDKKEENEEQAKNILIKNLNKLTREHLKKIFLLVDERYAPWLDRKPWFGRLLTPNANNLLMESESKINKWFSHVISEEISVVDKINNLANSKYDLNIRGASVGLITLILYLIDNSKYSIWWKIQHSGLKFFYSDRLSEYKKSGKSYLEFNKLSKEFTEKYGFRHVELDWIFSNVKRIL